MAWIFAEISNYLKFDAMMMENHENQTKNNKKDVKVDDVSRCESFISVNCIEFHHNGEPSPEIRV